MLSREITLHFAIAHSQWQLFIAGISCLGPYVLLLLLKKKWVSNLSTVSIPDDILRFVFVCVLYQVHYETFIPIQLHHIKKYIYPGYSIWGKKSSEIYILHLDVILVITLSLSYLVGLKTDQ
jgi:hypothetical protein